jgi:hypothetical protein
LHSDELCVRIATLSQTNQLNEANYMHNLGKALVIAALTASLYAQDAGKVTDKSGAEGSAPPVLKARTIELKDIKTIYIAPMAEDLDQYIKAEITKQLKGKLAVVTKESEADATLGGSGEVRKGTGAQITGRYLGLHDTATGAISLVSGDRILWSSEAGDRSMWFGAMKRGGQRKVADRLVHNLKKALEQAGALKG